MATLIVNVVGKGKVEYIPYPPDAKKIEIGDFVVDFSKLEKLLEWKPKIPFREGIEKTVDFYNNHPEYFSK